MTSSPVGIWRHAHIFGDGGAPAARALACGWTLGEGDTPLAEHQGLARELGVGRLLLKREDRNPGGSHKARGLLYQVILHRGPEPATCVLSSSGNAAAAAAAACRLTGDRLVVFVSPETPDRKMARILGTGAHVIQTLKPINFGRYAARVFGLQDLRGTRDPAASIGYRSLAAEIADQVPAVDAVFTFSSSGISMEGMADGFAALGRTPTLWAVQSGECVGIARALDPQVCADPRSPAGKLGIRNPPGADALAARLKQSGGGAIAVPANAVVRWSSTLGACGVRVSAEGGAVLAGIAATRELSRSTVVAIMTGSPPGPPPRAQEGEPISLASYLEVRRWFVETLGLQPVADPPPETE